MRSHSLPRCVLASLATIFSLVTLPAARAQTWSGIGGGMNDWVYAATVYNGDLIAGGKFTTAGGVAASHIARWNGTKWAALGSGLDGDVWSLTVYNGQLIAGGFFVNAGAVNVNFIAAWDGTTWTDLEGGTDSGVMALTVYDRKLIAGGYFTNANIPANHIASWDGHAWAPLGSGTGGSQGQVMALGTYGADLIAGGFFTSAGGVNASHIARWNGAAWSALGTGIDNIVYALTTYGGNLIAGGLFSFAGGVSAHDVAQWDGSAWSALGSGIGGGPYGYVLSLAAYGQDLVAGGIYTMAGGNPANNIARWDGSAWSPLGDGVSNGGSTAGVYALADYRIDLVAGGIFATAGSVNVHHIARWNSGPPASWLNYGSGWPGTNGVPPFTASGDPVLCQTVTLDLGNSLGAATQCALFIGLAPADLPTVYGGHLLLLPMTSVMLGLPAGGLALPGALPCDSALLGVSLYLQALEVDAGASRGVSFTPGLQLILGA
ncbi:MAG: hypothetical protein U1E76_06760 [Planctomycetota bacterium]